MKGLKKIFFILIPIFLCSCSRIDDVVIVLGDQTPFSESSPIDVTDISETGDTEHSEETAAPEVTTVQNILKDNIDYEAFESRISECASDNGVVGMGLCVFADGKIIYEINLGSADKELGIPCDENTIYRVASVSKLISTMALMTLYDEGVLTPYSDLQELTGLPYNADSSKDRVRLWHLLTHTAGLVDGSVYKDSPSKYYSTAYVLEKSNLGYVPGENYLYTNFGAGTIGSIVEILTNEYFHSFADRVIFSRLDMDAAYCANMLKNRENCAEIYNGGTLSISPKSWGRSTYYYESFGLGNSYLNAQCELLISPRDLAKLGIVISGDGSLDGVRILSEDAVNLINTSYYQSDDIPFDMGLSTRIYDGNLIEGHRIFGHSGCAYGNVCGLYYDPVNHTGIALCTNGCYIGTNSDNGVYRVIDKCIKCVYDTFFY